MEEEKGDLKEGGDEEQGSIDLERIAEACSEALGRPMHKVHGVMGEAEKACSGGRRASARAGARCRLFGVLLQS